MSYRDNIYKKLCDAEPLGLVFLIRELVTLIKRMQEVYEIDDLYKEYKCYMRARTIYQLLKKERGE